MKWAKKWDWWLEPSIFHWSVIKRWTRTSTLNETLSKSWENEFASTEYSGRSNCLCPSAEALKADLNSDLIGPRYLRDRLFADAGGVCILMYLCMWSAYAIQVELANRLSAHTDTNTGEITLKVTAETACTLIYARTHTFANRTSIILGSGCWSLQPIESKETRYAVYSPSENHTCEHKSVRTYTPIWNQQNHGFVC